MAVDELLAGVGWQNFLVQLPFLLLAYLVISVFYRHLFPERRPGEPPVKRSALPWIGSLFPFQKNKHAFVNAARSELGDVFTAIIGGRRLVFVCDYRCYQEVFRRSHDLSWSELKLRMVLPAFGRGDFMRVTDAYPDINTDLAKNLSGSHLAEVCARLEDAVRAGFGLPPLPGSDRSFYDTPPAFAGLNCKMWPGEGKEWHTVDLVSLMNLMTAVNCDVFLGPGTSDQQFRDDLHGFTKTYGILSMGLPEWLPLPALQEALKTRRRLLTAPCVQNHTEKTSNALLSRRRVFLERVGAPGVKHQTFADLGFLWASIVNTNQTTFWVLANLICHPDAMAAIKAELDSVLGVNGSLSTDPNELKGQLHRLVKLDSVISEVLRLIGKGFTVRIAMENLHLTVGAEKMAIRKDDFVFLHPDCVHRNVDIFGEDVDEFRWDRFLNDKKTGPRRFVDAKTGNHVPQPLIIFGGGVSMCPGRHFARDEIKLTVTTLLRGFDVELTSPDQALPKVDLQSLSTLMPLEGEKFPVRMKLQEQLC